MLAKDLFLIVSIIVITDSALIENLPKCSISDTECRRKLIGATIQAISKTGIPEFNVPPLDPMHIQDTTVSIQNVTEMTFIDANVMGLKDCVINKHDLNIEEGHSSFEATCDLSVKGSYKVVSESPVIKSLLGGRAIHGEGQGEINIEKLNLKLEWPIKIIKLNGDIYMRYDYDGLKFDSNVFGKTTFAADSIYIGDVDSTQQVLDILNQNEKLINKAFGHTIVEVLAKDYLNKSFKGFLDNVPIKYFILDDLTKYVKE